MQETNNRLGKLFAQNRQDSCLKQENWLVGPEGFEPTHS